MVAPWSRWRTKRRLRGLIGPEEQVLLIERLRTGGWWVATDQALYHVPRFADPERVPLAEIRSVHSLSAGSPVIVVTASGHQPLIGDLAANSVLAERLRELKPGGNA